MNLRLAFNEQLFSKIEVKHGGEYSKSLCSPRLKRIIV